MNSYDKSGLPEPRIEAAFYAQNQHEPKIYMRVAPLAVGGPNTLLKETNKSYRSSAKAIADFLQCAEGQNYIKHHKTENKERIINYLYDKAYNRSCREKISDVFKKIRGKTTSKDYYVEALASFNQASLSFQEFSGDGPHHEAPKEKEKQLADKKQELKALYLQVLGAITTDKCKEVGRQLDKFKEELTKTLNVPDELTADEQLELRLMLKQTEVMLKQLPKEGIINQILFNPNYSPEEKGLQLYLVHQQYTQEAARQNAAAVKGGADAVQGFISMVLDGVYSESTKYSQVAELVKQPINRNKLASTPSFINAVDRLKAQAEAQLNDERDHPIPGHEKMSDNTYELRLQQIRNLDEDLPELVATRYEFLLDQIAHRNNNIVEYLFNPHYSPEEKGLQLFLVQQQYAQEAARQNAAAVKDGADAVQDFFSMVLDGIYSDPTKSLQVAELVKQPLDRDELASSRSFINAVERLKAQAEAQLKDERDHPIPGQEKMSDNTYELRLQQIKDLDEDLPELVARRYEIFLDQIAQQNNNIVE